MEAEPVSPASAVAHHGEGAYWDAPRNEARFVDMLRGDVITVHDGTTRRDHVSDVAALIRGRVGGGYVIATERGFALTDDDLTITREIPVFDDLGQRMNEGACDAAGRLYCGTMRYDAAAGGGRLFRLDPDLSVHVAMDRVTIPNGLVWNSAGDAALHADTGDGVIWEYEFDAAAGTFGERRAFVRFDGSTGLPDGVAIDETGAIWVAMWGGGAVLRYDASGVLDTTVRIPAINVTSCAFGGPENRTLFVTTSRQDLTDPEPLAGRLFAVETEVRGADVHRFAG